jgi:hypothetical protein
MAERARNAVMSGKMKRAYALHGIEGLASSAENQRYLKSKPGFALFLYKLAFTTDFTQLRVEGVDDRQHLMRHLCDI